jgi:hypothetical protein
MGAIDDYLEDLSVRLRLTPDSAFRLLEEVETHLREAAEHETASGADPTVAEHRALARFGSAEQVARAANGGRWRVVVPGVHAAAQLVAVGCAAVVAGALLAEALAWLTSTGWVFGLPAGYSPSAGQAAHWLQVQPGAHGWRAAAASENASDTLVLRGAAGVVGLVAALVVMRMLRRHTSVGGGVLPAVGLTAFGGAAALLLTGALRTLDWGLGQSLCDAAVALIAASAYAVLCAKSVLLTSTAAADRV